MDEDKLMELNAKISSLETQCHFFHLQLERIEHLYTMVKHHELKIFDLEENLNKKNL